MTWDAAAVVGGDRFCCEERARKVNFESCESRKCAVKCWSETPGVWVSPATPGESYERRGRKGRGLFSGPSVPSVVRERRASEACFVFASRGNAFVPKNPRKLRKMPFPGTRKNHSKSCEKTTINAKRGNHPTLKSCICFRNAQYR